MSRASFSLVVSVNHFALHVVLVSFVKRGLQCPTVKHLTLILSDGVPHGADTACPASTVEALATMGYWPLMQRNMTRCNVVGHVCLRLGTSTDDDLMLHTHRRVLLL